jgi:hypothetical protein
MAKPKSAVVNIKAATIHPDSGAMTTAPAKPKGPGSIMDDYDAGDHLRTLAQAHNIMTDPMKMKKVNKLMNFHKQAINHTKDISDYYQQKYGGPGGGPKPGGAPKVGSEDEGMEE